MDDVVYQLDEFIFMKRTIWNDMFEGGYIGDGVCVEDLDFVEEFENMTEEDKEKFWDDFVLEFGDYSFPCGWYDPE